MSHYLDLAQKLIPIARAAGDIEVRYFHEGATVMDKNDGSPVTLADQEAEHLITAALAELAPGIPVIGEEAVAAGNIPDISSGTFFLVDPLDGTREFVEGGGQFTVNIALLEKFIPVMGLIYVPLTEILYIGSESFAFKGSADGDLKQISVRQPPEDGLTVLTSKRHGDMDRIASYLNGRTIKDTLPASSSLKFCMLAEGSADLYPRLGPTSEWDTAAGEAILRAAGGVVERLDGKPLVYGKHDVNFKNPEFIAYIPQY